MWCVKWKFGASRKSKNNGASVYGETYVEASSGPVDALGGSLWESGEMCGRGSIMPIQNFFKVRRELLVSVL